MKIFICLLALVCGSNATFTKLLAAFGAGSRTLLGGDSSSDSIGPGAGNGGGGGGGGVGPSDGRGPGGGWSSGGGNVYGPNMQYSQGGYQGGAPPPVYKVILSTDHGFGNGGYDGGHSYSGGGPMGGFNGGHGYPGAGGQAEVYHVISENAGPSGYASHDSGYPRGNDGNAFLESILPQILQAIFQADAAGPGGPNGFGGNNHISLQIADNFDQGGRASFTQGGSQRSNYFNSGRVVESGELRIRRIMQGPNGGGAAQGSLGVHPLAALLSSGSPSSEW